MVTFLVIGHVCELPAHADLVLPLHATGGHSADGHGHESELSCDPVDTVLNTAPVQGMAPALEIAHAWPAISAGPGRPVPPSSIESSTRPPSRPPLFVLYASLLI